MTQWILFTIRAYRPTMFMPDVSNDSGLMDGLSYSPDYNWLIQTLHAAN